MQIQSYTSQLNNYKALNYNAPKSNHKKNENVSFGFNPVKAGYGKLTSGLAYGFGWLGSTKPMKGLVDYLQDKNYARHIAAFVGVVLSGFYMTDTAKSKNIKKDQKLPLMINQGAVCALATAGAYTIDKFLDKKLSNFTDNFHIASMSNDEHKKIFLQLKENPADLDLLKEASEQIKSPRQLFNKKLLDVIDDPAKFKELSESKDFFKDEYARKLVKEVRKSANPKKLLEDNYNSKELFYSELKEKFKFDGSLKAKLTNLVKKGEGDSVVEQLLKDAKALVIQEKEKLQADALKMAEQQKISVAQAKRILKEDMDILGKISELCLKNVKNSKILQKEFCKQSFNNAIDMIAENDEKLSINKKGFRYGKSIMVFAMIYRFIAPVIATPIANKISDKLEARKKAKTQIKPA